MASSGIAVGMATNIPPHNMGETINALIALVDNPDVSVEELMVHLPGPIFLPAGSFMARRDPSSLRDRKRGDPGPSEGDH